MSVRQDIARGWELPADAVPFAGLQIERALGREDLRDALATATVTTRAPSWAHGRTADAWLVADGADVACPMVWRDGELAVTAVLERPAKLTAAQLPASGEVPADLVSIAFTGHVVERYRVRVRPTLSRPEVQRELEAILPACRVSRQPPASWNGNRPTYAFLRFADEHFVCPLTPSRGRLVAVTLYVEGTRAEDRAERRESAARDRARREVKRRGRRPGGLPEIYAIVSDRAPGPSATPHLHVAASGRAEGAPSHAPRPAQPLPQAAAEVMDHLIGAEPITPALAVSRASGQGGRSAPNPRLEG